MTNRHIGMLALHAAIMMTASVWAHAAYPAWAEGNTYVAGSYVSYNGRDYQALITHTAYVGAGWNPAVTNTLWRDLGPSSGAPAPQPTPAPIPTATPLPTAPPAGQCSHVLWQAGVNYTLGTVVLYQGSYYRVKAVTANGTDGTIPTISTWYWEPTTCSGSTTPTPLPTATPQPTATPRPPTPAPQCSYVVWQAGVNYPLGTVVLYQGSYYRVKAVGANGSDATIPTISTWYWEPASCNGSSTPTPTPANPTPTPVSGSARKIVGGYWSYWPDSQIRIRDVPAGYNLIYLFSATPVGGSPGTTGAVQWNTPGNGRGAATNLKADIQYARTTQGRKIILSVGGAGNGMSFPSRAKSQAFLDSVIAIYDQLGGFDGLDWNTFEADQQPDTAEMIWISQQLKARYPGFLISAPPAPWNARDKSFCYDMLLAGVLDYCAPQYYDGPNLAEVSYVVNNVNEWVALLGAEHVVVGFGIWNQTNYMNIGQATSAWNQIKASHPNIRGAFNWQISTDETQGWPFASQMPPLVNP